MAYWIVYICKDPDIDSKYPDDYANKNGGINYDDGDDNCKNNNDNTRITIIILATKRNDVIQIYSSMGHACHSGSLRY